MGKRRPVNRSLAKQGRNLQTTFNYSYQVDVYIEIDFNLCAKNNEACSNGVDTKTLNYINVLFAEANTVYEGEIDTHLNVVHIDVNNDYASAGSTSNALTQMRNTYSGSTNWADSNADLHHGLFGASMGGGIAYLGVLCNKSFGFGLSASLQGQYTQMTNNVVWDFMVFMHELGKDSLF